MAKLNENKKILTIGVGGLVMCLASGGAIWWARSVVEQVTADIVATEQQIDAAKRKIDQIPNLEKGVIILRENVDTYTKILPQQSEVSDFVRTTNRFSFQSGVELKQFLKGATGKRGKYSHYSYRIDLEATLWQFLKFINLFETYDRFIRVVNFDIKSADRGETERALAEGKDPRHKISLVIETFVYEAKNSSKNVDIPNYSKKREKLESEILAGARAIELERFEYVEKIGRRDIFVDPRPTVGGAILGDNQRAVQKKTIDEFVQRLAEAQVLHDQWKRSSDYLTKENLARQLRQMMAALEQESITAQPKITTQSLVADWNNSVIQPMREILRDLRGEADVPDAVDEQQLRAILAEMRAAVQRGEYDAATRLHDEVIDRLAFPEADPRFALAVQIQKTKEAVQTIVEFGDITMKIDGVVVFDEGRSGLLVNGKVYEEGEYLDENLLLKAVGREQADFVFKGFVVRKKW